ncbi:MAG: hypothetical protein FJ033_14705, partial [Chloroflexi bacterium]|nr:hypothetical protein [Chloroflexota bacterium]
MVRLTADTRSRHRCRLQGQTDHSGRPRPSPRSGRRPREGCRAAGRIGHRSEQGARAVPAVTGPLTRVQPGVKVTAQISPEAKDEDLAFIRQMGVEHVVLWTDASKSSATYYAERKEHFRNNGLQVYGFGNRDVHNQPAIVLNTPEGPAKIEEYKRHLQALGKAGIPYTTYAHMPNGIWSTDRETTRGGASARAFDLAKATFGRWHTTEFHLPLTNGRIYTDDEVWEN